MTRLVAVLMFAVGCPSVDAGAAPDRFADHEAIVRDTHQASLAARERSLRDTVSRDAYWIKGAWGDTIWALAALYRNDKTDAANDQIGRASGRERVCSVV